MTALGGDTAAAKLAAVFLLTLPGLPFLYYGEEIGMTGDKPDERIRTPMQWSADRGAGFTTGAAWEPLQPDWARTNVAVQEGDTSSLLHVYRRLIHLRGTNAALAKGRLERLDTNDDRLAAYLRRDGDAALLVVANLGAAPMRPVLLSSSAAVLAPGRYVPRPLFGGAAAALTADASGRIARYVPFSTIGPKAFAIVELVRTGP
jgi:glycosidase